MKPISVDGSRFVDAQGRHVILHGISMVCKDKSKGYIDDWSEEDFRKLRQWGFNVIRLGIIWDGVEPNPGEYDVRYIEKIREQIRLAYRFGIYVFLDMHQDLFSSRFSDGAPGWATLTDGHSYAPTALWSDAYLFDRAVQTAFDHFWANSPASDGVGLQDHYAAAWRFVAARLRDEPNLIGYDLMNEPFIGSKVEEMVGGMFTSYGELAAEYTGQPAPDVEQLFEIWSHPEQKLQALSLLDSPDAYRRIMEATAPAQVVFERSVLTPFFRKVGQAIREEDPDGILFLETNYFSNLGVPSSILPVTDVQDRRDGQQAFAPHGYDLVTDSEYVHAANSGRVDYIFESHERTRSRLEMPMLIGEWGAYGESELAEEAALQVQRNFERLLCSDAYWCYLYPEMDRYSSFNAVCRSYPMATSGTLLSYSYDRDRNAFNMEWEEDAHAKAPTLVFLQNIQAAISAGLRLSPMTSGYEWSSLKDTKAGVLSILPSGGGRRTLTVG
ncbi:cellulase family glycosylhydrolase [Cohnella herbarum]|uniref:Cellulase family glycosylhydrolase n=1 Tax=Cohnella herbarum TaxID=2728023 RepID=A0A7Z2ZPE7_9BACL|nr:cellulase family glycosylhydrolase [Cohnella herbarum]QJD87094.1 cellulase family glycosylhydrolase [Cohnella herbarum]